MASNVKSLPGLFVTDDSAVPTSAGAMPSTLPSSTGDKLVLDKEKLDRLREKLKLSVGTNAAKQKSNVAGENSLEANHRPSLPNLQISNESEKTPVAKPPELSEESTNTSNLVKRNGFVENGSSDSDKIDNSKRISAAMSREKEYAELIKVCEVAKRLLPAEVLKDFEKQNSAPKATSNSVGVQTVEDVTEKEKLKSLDTNIRDWLELTGFHDQHYRQGELLRFRKEQELEKQKQAMQAKQQAMEEELEQLRSERQQVFNQRISMTRSNSVMLPCKMSEGKTGSMALSNPPPRNMDLPKQRSSHLKIEPGKRTGSPGLVSPRDVKKSSTGGPSLSSAKAEHGTSPGMETSVTLSSPPRSSARHEQQNQGHPRPCPTGPNRPHRGRNGPGHWSPRPGRNFSNQYEYHSGRW